MITVKQESVLIKKLKSLTELELQGVLEELAEHIYKNNLGDMVEAALDTHDLQGEIRSLEEDVRNVEDERDEYRSKCQKASYELQDIENIDDDLQKEIDRIIEILE